MASEASRTDGADVKSQTLAYCESILDFNNSKIEEVDRKATFLTGISGLLALLVSRLLLEGKGIDNL